MGDRTFMDSAGIEWRVWEVHPQLRDRRAGPDRRLAAAPDPIVERRIRPDRRVRARPRAVLRAEYQEGWLCFHAGTFRRRLVPIPHGWEACSDAELEAHCRRAEDSGAVRIA